MKFLKNLAIFILLSISILLCAQDSKSTAPTAIIGAFDSEVELIKTEMTEKKTVTLLQIPFITGKLKGKSTILCETGVGKVNAAITTTLLLYYFKPKEVIFTGIAGSLDPKILPADIVIGAKCAQHDHGDYWQKEGFVPEGPRNPRTGYNIPLYLKADPRLLKIAQKAATQIQFNKIKIRTGFRVPKVRLGTILTGDIFVAAKTKIKELRERFKGHAVEMEGAAVAQVCYLNKIPHIIIRSISDAGGTDVGKDFHQFYKTAAHNSAKLVIKMIDLL